MWINFVVTVWQKHIDQQKHSFSWCYYKICLYPDTVKIEKLNLKIFPVVEFGRFRNALNRFLIQFCIDSKVSWLRKWFGNSWKGSGRFKHYATTIFFKE